MPARFAKLQDSLIIVLPGGWGIDYMTLTVVFNLGILRETYRVTYLNMEETTWVRHQPDLRLSLSWVTPY